MNWEKCNSEQCSIRQHKKGEEKLYQFEIDWRNVHTEKRSRQERERASEGPRLGNHTMPSVHSFGSSLVIFSTIKYNEKENWTILYLIECSLCRTTEWVRIFIRDGKIDWTVAEAFQWRWVCGMGMGMNFTKEWNETFIEIQLTISTYSQCLDSMISLFVLFCSTRFGCGCSSTDQMMNFFSTLLHWQTITATVKRTIHFCWMKEVLFSFDRLIQKVANERQHMCDRNGTGERVAKWQSHQ